MVLGHGHKLQVGRIPVSSVLHLLTMMPVHQDCRMLIHQHLSPIHGECLHGKEIRLLPQEPLKVTGILAKRLVFPWIMVRFATQ